MAHTVESRITTPASELRERLDKVERQLPTLDTATVVEFLPNLDRIEALFVQLAGDNADVRSEVGRWDDIQRQIERRAGQIVKLANEAGRLRSTAQTEHPPAELAPGGTSTPRLATRRRRLADTRHS